MKMHVTITQQAKLVYSSNDQIQCNLSLFRLPASSILYIPEWSKFLSLRCPSSFSASELPQLGVQFVKTIPEIKFKQMKNGHLYPKYLVTETPQPQDYYNSISTSTMLTS